MSKVSEKQKTKRSSILDSAYDLFVSKSFNNTSIDDVVKKAGIAKGTFYLYFKDKYDLLDRIVIKKSLDLLESAFETLGAEKEKRENNMSFTDQMLFLVERIVDSMQSNRELVALMNKRLFSNIGALITDESHGLREHFDSLIEDGGKLGINREAAIRKIYMTVSTVGSVCSDAIIYGSPFKLGEIRPELMAAVAGILHEGSGPRT